MARIQIKNATAQTIPTYLKRKDVFEEVRIAPFGVIEAEETNLSPITEAQMSAGILKKRNAPSIPPKGGK